MEISASKVIDPPARARFYHRNKWHQVDVVRVIYLGDGNVRNEIVLPDGTRLTVANTLLRWSTR